MLSEHLDFTKPSFRSQLWAVAIKSLTFQKRQLGINCCCLVLLPLLLLVLFILLVRLPGIIYQGNTIVCADTSPDAYLLDDSVTNPNMKRVTGGRAMGGDSSLLFTFF